MTIEEEIREVVAWVEIDRITEMMLAMPPRSLSRAVWRAKLAELMRAKLEREAA